MAKPKLALPPPDAIRALADSEGRLALRVTPGAKAEGMEVGDGILLVKVRTKPEGGGANDAVLKMLAKALDTAPSGLTLISGATGRNKRVQIAAP